MEIKIQQSDEERKASTWHAVFRKDGQIGYCSCGRPLVRISDTEFRCSAGYPQYSLEEGSVFIGKDGMLYIEPKPHQQGKKE